MDRVRRISESPYDSITSLLSGDPNRDNNNSNKDHKTQADVKLLSEEDHQPQEETKHRAGSSRLSNITKPQRFSVNSRTREFNVINYGQESLDDSFEQTAVDQQYLSLSSLPRGREHRDSERSIPFSPTSFKSVDYQMSPLPQEQGFAPGIKEQITEESEITDESSCLTVDIPDNVSESDEYKEKVKKKVSFPQYEEQNDKSIHSISLNRSFKSRHTQPQLELVKLGKAYGKRKKDRLIDKNGECKIVYSNIKKRSTRLLNDFFTTMLEIKWRYHLLLVSLSFGLSWLVFGLLWWAIVAVDVHNNSQVNYTMGEEYIPCVDGVTDFMEAILFSIETQQTIGYGTRAITTSCTTATLLVMLQSIFGVLMQCVVTGFIFAKIARPKRRAQTILFSKMAVICERDGTRYLMFRVGDMRKSQILGANIQAMIAETKVTKEGEYLPINSIDLEVTTESGSGFFFLAWPINVVHKIDASSPLWNISEMQLLQKDWELIVVLEGVAEVTGTSFQVRTSYLPSEILWGHRLKCLVNKRSGGIHEIDYTCFHHTESTDISEESAKCRSFIEKGIDIEPSFKQNGVYKNKKTYLRYLRQSSAMI